MSNQKSGKLIFWKSWFFWLVIIVTIYLVSVKVEEKAYNNFINSEWPTHTIKYTSDNSPLVGEYMNKLITDDKGRVWIITDRAVNIVAPDGSWSTLTKDNKNISAQSLVIDKSKRIWIGTFDGLYVLNPNGQWITYDEKSKTVYEHYTSSSMLIDRFERIWVANNDGLRMFLPDGTKTFYTRKNSELEDDYITALEEDHQGNIWVGTRTKGIVVIDKDGRWKTHQANASKQGLVENWVTSLFIDDRDQVWIGTWRRGISMLSPNGNWTTYDTTLWGRQSDPEYYDPDVNAFARDRQGRLWIGTWDALFALDERGNRIAYTRANSAIDSMSVKALTIDGNGRLWIATHKAIFVLDLRNELPKTVSNRWVQLRNEILKPIKVAKGFGEILFFPVLFLGTNSFNFCSITYVVLLAAIIPAILGMQRSSGQKKTKLQSVSLTIFILSIVGASIIWLLTLLLAMIPT